MANYNTFVVIDCKKRRPILVTSSARNANKLLVTGNRVEVWNNQNCVEIIHNSDRRKEPSPLYPYIEQEKEYHKQKQINAEKRNARKKTTLAK